MNLAHWGLEKIPFRIVPALDGYYPATSHERSFADLNDALEAGDGLCFLTGQTGLGKTLIAQRLLEHQQESYQTSYLASIRLQSSLDLWQALLFDLNLSHTGTESELRLRYLEASLQSFQAGKRTLLILDEAQQLSSELIEELRLLTNLEGRRGKAVQILLVGERDLHFRLRTDRLHLTQKRYGCHARLEPFTPEESMDYLRHQVRICGSRVESIFDEEAIELILSGTNGIPLRLNRLCFQSMLIAERNDYTVVDAEIVLEAFSRLGLPIPPEKDSTPIEGISVLNPSTIKLSDHPTLFETAPEEPTTIPLQIPIERPRGAAVEVRDDGSKVLIYSGDDFADESRFDAATAEALLKQQPPLRHAN